MLVSIAVFLLVGLFIDILMKPAENLFMDCTEAYAWGMVNRLCAPGKVVEEALETACRIADNAPISVRQAKHAMHYGLQMDLASGMMLEIEAYNRMVPTEDRREGIASFNEKRKPKFKGR